MGLYESATYKTDLVSAIRSTEHFSGLNGKRILITGATGIIGSYIVDMLLTANREFNADILIYAMSRNRDKLEKRFIFVKTDKLHYIEHDVNEEIRIDFPMDYIIHAASNSYPDLFDIDPVGTIMSNVLGTYHLLTYGNKNGALRFLYISSGEVYGQGDLNLDSFEETYGGYVDPTQPRSCYPNSKRTGETLCSSFSKQYGLDTVIVRPCHTYGPNVTIGDNRANVQFMNNVLRGENIVMKSSGNQMRSYSYIADCGSAILTVLINGKNGEAYNIANTDERVTIAEFAQIVADIAGKEVIFEKSDKIANADHTPITKQVLNNRKLERLGWKGTFTIEEGIKHTLNILTGK